MYLLYNFECIGIFDVYLSYLHVLLLKRLETLE